ncbi:hypothetical protein CHU93_00300 [Sandarakinorhabdus cyanobacteriorum]|uniref:Nuclear transport factor 2 family protein n=2 Tax=Sandarakinorhabdus cyanobacteriorum TaxID=1981098 RepID=A0A255ZAI4_9SPHN|nr:hypothetical protein CHU93_00300 [Sandarakinorhabdus cyanobacteriorum]
MTRSGLNRLGMLLLPWALAGNLNAAQPQIRSRPSMDHNATASMQTAAAKHAVERYFQAADSGSAEAVRNAFLPNGRVEGVLGGKIVSWTAAEFAERNFRGSPPANVEAIRRTIEWLDVSGPGAVARVRVNIGANAVYWDYFILFNVSGEWKIGLKAFANPEQK